MIEFDRRLKVKPRNTSGQCSIENAGSIPYEIWDAEYVNLSGFCGPHSPHTLAAAPVMLEACKAVLAVNDGIEPAATAGDRVAMWASAFNQIRAAIAAAEGE